MVDSMKISLPCSSCMLKHAAIAAHSGHDVSYTAWGAFGEIAMTSSQSGFDSGSRRRYANEVAGREISF
jgi:hypothetical protein